MRTPQKLKLNQPSLSPSNKKSVKAEEKSVTAEEKSVKAEEKSVKTEEKSVKTEEKSVKKREKSVKRREKAATKEEKSVIQREKSVNKEENSAKKGKNSYKTVEDWEKEVDLGVIKRSLDELEENVVNYFTNKAKDFVGVQMEEEKKLLCETRSKENLKALNEQKEIAKLTIDYLKALEDRVIHTFLFDR